MSMNHATSQKVNAIVQIITNGTVADLANITDEHSGNDTSAPEDGDHHEHEEMLYRLEYQYQTWIVGLLAVLINILLLYVLKRQNKKKSLLGSYQMVLYYTTTMNICFAVVNALTLPSIHIHDGAVFIVSGNQYLPAHFCKFLILIFMFFFIQSSVLFTLVFANRCITMSMSRDNPFQKPSRRVMIVLATYLALFIWLILAAIAMWRESKFELDIHMESEFSDLATLSADLNENTFFDMILVFLIIILLTSFISQVCFVVRIFRTLSNLKKDEINRKTTRLILYQTCVPVLFLHLPIYLSVFLPMVGYSEDAILLLLPFAFTWFPLLDPLLILTRVKTYRNTLIVLILTLIGQPPTSKTPSFLPMRSVTSVVIKF